MEPATMEADKVHELLDAARSSSQRDYLMLRVLWRTGVMVNELLNIKLSDIERRNNVVNVTKARGGKQRRVPLDSDDPDALGLRSRIKYPGRVSPYLASSKGGSARS